MSDKNKPDNVTDFEALRNSEIVKTPCLFYEMIVYGESGGEKAVGSMRLSMQEWEKVKVQILQRKDKLVFTMLGTDWPMSINTDKYARVWLEIIEEHVAKGEKGSVILDPNTLQPAKSETKIIKN